MLMKDFPSFSRNPRGRGFSLVEMITAVGIIGIILFLAIPNIVRVREDSELNLAVARAEALNMAMASYMQAMGRINSQTLWSTMTNDQRYGAVQPYMQYAPNSLAGFLPGYAITFPTTLGNQEKVHLFQGGVEIAY